MTQTDPFFVTCTNIMNLQISTNADTHHKVISANRFTNMTSRLDETMDQLKRINLHTKNLPTTTEHLETVIPYGYFAKHSTKAQPTETTQQVSA